MLLICSVWNCPSNQLTEINGRRIELFPYPNDETVQSQWNNICKSVCEFDNESKETFRICELHFEKECFNENVQLKFNAVPTIFEHPNRRKWGKSFKRLKTNISPPLKKHKSENKNSYTKSGKEMSEKHVLENENSSMELNEEIDESDNHNLDNKSSSTEMEEEFLEEEILEETLEEETLEEETLEEGTLAEETLEEETLEEETLEDDTLEEEILENENSALEANEELSIQTPFEDEADTPEFQTPKSTRYRLVIKIYKSKSKITTNPDWSKKNSPSGKKTQKSLLKPSVKKSLDELNERNLRISNQIVLNEIDKFRLSTYKRSNPINRCKLGCELEKIFVDDFETFRCLKCSNVYRKNTPTQSEVLLTNNVQKQSLNQVQTLDLKNHQLFKLETVQTPNSKNMHAPNSKEVQTLNSKIIQTPNSRINQTSNSKIIQTPNSKNVQISSLKNVQTLQLEKNRIPNFKMTKAPLEVTETILISDEDETIDEGEATILSSEEDLPLEPFHESCFESKDQSLITTKPNVLTKVKEEKQSISRCENGCQLRKIVLNNSVAFKCLQCCNIFVPKPDDKSNNNLQSTNAQVVKNNAKDAEKNVNSSERNVNSSEENDKTDENNKNFQCSICRLVLSSRNEFFLHIKEHLTCDICYCSFKTQFEIRSHMNLHSSQDPNNPFQCHICDFTFDSRENLRHHNCSVHKLQSKSKVESVQQTTINFSQCKDCNIIFLKQEEFRNHMEVLHSATNQIVPSVSQLNTVKFACTICGMEFPTLNAIQIHTEIHINATDKNFKCNVCQQIFKCNNLFLNHLKEHISRYNCSKCSQTFNDEDSLQNHAISHI